MAGSEKRHPREFFTKKLIRMCQRLDQASTHDVPSFNPFIRKSETIQVTVEKLWVVGSYARGALDCGDLDILLEGVVSRATARSSSITRVFFKSPAYVRFYYGSPEINTSNVSFPDAVCIWSRPGCDWNGAIDSIKPNPKAGRAEREVDAIPFHAEQLQSEHETLEELVELRDQRIVEWDFMQIDDAALIPIPAEGLSASERRLLRITHNWGKKSLRLVPAMIRLVREHEPFGQWERSGHGGRAIVHYGGTEIRYGRPPLHRLFEDRLAIRQIALIPHIRAQGPNGAWLIRHGPQHPDTLPLLDSHAFYLASPDGPDTFIQRDPYNPSSFELVVLELFTSEADAQECADNWNSEIDDGDFLKVMKSEGSDLLRLTGLCDLIEIGDIQLPITWRASRHLQREVIKGQELAAALAGSKA